MPLYILFSEHRVYLSLGGLALLSAHLWRPLPRGRPFLVPVALLLILSSLTVLRNGVWQDELVLWLDASRQAPDDARVWAGLGEAYYRRGEVDSALAAYRYSLDLRPGNEVPWNNLGVLHEEAGRLEPAEAAYRTALRLRPEWPEAQANLGRMLLQTGRADEAAPLLGRAAARSPSAGVLVNLGVAAARDGRIDVAAQAFTEALRLDPGHAKARVNLAALRLEQALNTDAPIKRQLWLQEAAHLSQEVLESMGEPGHPVARLNLAAVYAAQGRQAEARQLSADMLQGDGASAYAYEGYGRLLLASGDPGAAHALRRGIELGAASTRNWQDLGRAEAARRRWSAASAAFRAAADLAPGDPGPLYNLGEVSFKRWEQAQRARDPAAARWRQEAIEVYGAVDALEPGYRGVRQRLRELGVATP
jgi:Flp pilus assembly protein TadD